MSATEDIVRFYVKENEHLQKELSKAQEKIAMLQSEVDYLNEFRQPKGQSGCLQEGQELDLYPDERREVLLDVIKEARKGISEGSRRACIVDDFLRNNPSRGEPKKRAKEFKEILKGYRGLDEATRRKLRDLGVVAKDQHRKHYLLKYYGDGRFLVTMTATGGDAGRGGKNLAADMIRKFL